MINMAIILDGSIDEDNVQEVLDILLNRYLESDNLVSSSANKKYNKKRIKERYKEYKEYIPYNDYDIDSFEDFAEEMYNIIGFVGEYPIMSVNPESLFDSFEIEDIYRKSEIDIYDIPEDLDYLVTKSGMLYEAGSYYSTHSKELVKILEKCNYNDYVVIIVGYD